MSYRFNYRTNEVHAVTASGRHEMDINFRKIMTEDRAVIRLRILSMAAGIPWSVWSACYNFIKHRYDERLEEENDSVERLVIAREIKTIEANVKKHNDFLKSNKRVMREDVKSDYYDFIYSIKRPAAVFCLTDDEYTNDEEESLSESLSTAEAFADGCSNYADMYTLTRKTKAEEEYSDVIVFVAKEGCEGDFRSLIEHEASNNDFHCIAYFNGQKAFFGVLYEPLQEYVYESTDEDDWCGAFLLLKLGMEDPDFIRIEHWTDTLGYDPADKLIDSAFKSAREKMFSASEGAVSITPVDIFSDAENFVEYALLPDWGTPYLREAIEDTFPEA